MLPTLHAVEEHSLSPAQTKIYLTPNYITYLFKVRINILEKAVTLDHGFGCIAYICRPQSRGHLTLKSSDPNDEPLLYPNYLSEEEDVIDTRNAFRETRRILMQPAFDPYRGEPSKPGPEFNVDDDDELDNWVRETGETLYHPVSTCKMGER